MIHPDDVTAWLAQVRQKPEAAPGIIEKLAARVIELDRQNEALRDEVLRLRRSGPTGHGDTERVATLTRRIQSLERRLGQAASVGPVSRSLLVLTLDGRGARLPWPDVAAPLHARQYPGKRADRDLVAEHLRPRYLLVAADAEKLLLLSDKGRAARTSVAEIVQAQAPVNYLSLLPALRLDLDEAVSVIQVIPADFDQMTLVTRKGYARSFRPAEVDSMLERNLPLHSSPVTGDYPALAVFGDGKGELLIVTRRGKGVRFPERAVGVQSKPAINLDRGDVVVGATLVDDTTTVALVGAAGRAARRELAGFGAHPSPGHRGKIATRINDLVAVAPVAREEILWLLTVSGRLLKVPARQVPSGPGASGGKTVVQLGEDRVVALAVSGGD